MKKAKHIIGKILTIAILLFAIFIMVFTIISVNTVGKDQGMFGYKPYIVLSDSMNGVFEVGDIAVSKETDADNLKKGDIISFKSIDPNNGYKPYIVLSDSMNGVFEVGDIAVSKETDADNLKKGDIISFKSIDPNNYDTVVTHKIKKVTKYQGEKAYVTYGVNTGAEDAYPVPADRVIGEYQFRLPKMGYFFQFLKTPMGYFVLIFIPFMLLIGSEAFRFRKLWKQYKTEQAAELLEQQAAELLEQKTIVEEQKAQSEEMKAEIERLKAQLAEQSKKNNEK